MAGLEWLIWAMNCLLLFVIAGAGTNCPGSPAPLRASLKSGLLIEYYTELEDFAFRLHLNTGLARGV
jgi:hypothetical protein